MLAGLSAGFLFELLGTESVTMSRKVFDRAFYI